MPITYEHAPHGSEYYRQSLALREQVLRIPLGMTIRPEDTQHDSEQHHYVALKDGKVIGTISLAHSTPTTAKLRQMAVDTLHHGQGVGAGLMAYAHDQAQALGYSHITLNARDTAIGFYEKLGYHAVGDIFTEIGIPHQRMEKP